MLRDTLFKFKAKYNNTPLVVKLQQDVKLLRITRSDLFPTWYVVILHPIVILPKIFNSTSNIALLHFAL